MFPEVFSNDRDTETTKSILDHEAIGLKVKHREDKEKKHSQY